MTREERLNEIFSEFDKQIKLFSRRTGALTCEISSNYKGEEKTENLTHRFADVTYGTYLIEFQYTAQGMMSLSSSILECLVFLEKDGQTPPVPLSLLLCYIGIDEPTPLTIPLISGREAMRQACECIFAAIKRSENAIDALSENAPERERIVTEFALDATNVLGIKLKNDENPRDEAIQYLNPAIYDYLTIRLSSAPFQNYIRGDRKKAVKQLQKTKRPLVYEQKLSKLWAEEESDSNPLSAIRENLSFYTKGGTEKISAKEFSVMFLSWLALCIITTAIYSGLYLLVMLVEGWGSVYLMGPLYNLPFCFVAGFVTAIALSYYTRLWFYKRLFPKSYERYVEMDHIRNGKASDRIIGVMLVFLVVASLIMLYLFARMNLNFREEGFVDNSEFFSISGEYHDYSEIEKIYYKPNRVNSLGETLEYPSHVLVLTDGTEIDFYEFDEIGSYDKLLRHLGDRGVTIEVE